MINAVFALAMVLTAIAVGMFIIWRLAIILAWFGDKYDAWRTNNWKGWR